MSPTLTKKMQKMPKETRVEKGKRKEIFYHKIQIIF